MPFLANAAAARYGSELRFILPVAGLMLGGLALACTLLWIGGRQQDEMGLRHERRLVEHAIGSAVADIGVIAKDYGWWDDAVRHVVLDFNRDWIDGNPGIYVQDTFGYEYSFILDGADQTIYAAVDGERVAAEAFATLSEGLAELVAEARQVSAVEPVQAAGLLPVDGGVAAVAAAVIMPQEGSTLALPPGPRSVLIFGKRLDAGFLQTVADGFGIHELRRLPAATAAPRATLALTAADGTPLGLIGWQPGRPGQELLARVMPWLLGALLVFVAFAAVVMGSIRRAAAMIRFNETRFRDIAEASSDWIWETDRELRVEFVSERFEAVTGVGREAVLGRTLHELLHPAEDPARWARHLNDLAGRRPFRDLRCRLNGARLAQQTLRFAGKPILDARDQFQGYRGTATDITAALEAQAEAWHTARHDPLTGLPNRLLLRERAEQALAEYRRSHAMAAVLCLDLDRFKEINDGLGHAAGDLLIRGCAERLSACLRETDLVARLGGDEFAVLQVGLADAAEVQRLGERLLAELSRPFALDGHQVVVTASVGAATVPLDGDDPDVLLHNADTALSRAKTEGRNRLRFFEPGMDARLRARKRLEAELRRALERSELEVHYQPQAELRSGRLVGLEALVRWQHPERGLLPAAEFIEIAEETGLILDVGAWLLPAACREAAPWGGIRLSVNLSPVQLKHADLVAMVGAALTASGLEPHRLELEIAESILRSDRRAALLTLMELKELGVRIAIGDFATGDSSLTFLREFPFDKLKIDRLFVRELADDVGAEAIVEAVVGLGRRLGLQTCAEGVERIEQLRLLEHQGCDEVQGYLFSEAVPAAVIASLIERAGSGPMEIEVDSRARRA
jgi:diguanylate cyclase (GGDEF)-like protein/PAS domain S-box-containing protein